MKIKRTALAVLLALADVGLSSASPKSDAPDKKSAQLQAT